MMKYNNTLRESWASYVGWELSRHYYTSLRWVEPSPSDITYSDFSGEARQGWKRTDRKGVKKDCGEYSPLFVDLRDDHNQRHHPWENAYSIYLDDDVSGISYTTINKIAAEANNLDDFRSILTPDFTRQFMLNGSGVLEAMDKAAEKARNYVTPYVTWVSNH